MTACDSVYTQVYRRMYVWHEKFWLLLEERQRFNISGIQHLGHSTFRAFNISGIQHLGHSTFRAFNISGFQHFGHSTFRAFNISGIQHFGHSTFRARAPRKRNHLLQSYASVAVLCFCCSLMLLLQSYATYTHTYIHTPACCS